MGSPSTTQLPQQSGQRCSSVVSSSSLSSGSGHQDISRVDRLKRELSSPPNSCSDTTQHSSGGGGGGLNVIYDSRRGIPSSVGATGSSHTASLGEDGRAPSPEHVRIPAHPVQIPMLLNNVAEARERNRKQPPPNRRRVTKSSAQPTN